MSKYEAEIKKIKESGLFDPDWYLKQYPDIAALNMDPIEHYCWLGARLRRNPSACFETSFYITSYPDAAESDINPLIYYIDIGKSKGHKTVPPQENQSDGSNLEFVDLFLGEKELREENELLLLQLHQVQEELESYYLKYQELKNQMEGKRI